MGGPGKWKNEMTKRNELKSAIQSVRGGARESALVLCAAHQGNASVRYVRTSRGIERDVYGPAGQDWGRRLVART